MALLTVQQRERKISYRFLRQNDSNNPRTYTRSVMHKHHEFNGFLIGGVLPLSLAWFGHDARAVVRPLIPNALSGGKHEPANQRHLKGLQAREWLGWCVSIAATPLANAGRCCACWCLSRPQRLFRDFFCV